MYTPAHFAESRLPVLHELMQQYPLAAIVASSKSGLEANHVPLVLETARGQFGTLCGHIARSNSMWQDVPAGAEVLVVFQGANHYVSPNWYPSKQDHGKVVPTWNYSVVHARGRIEWFQDPVWLRALLEKLTDHHEAAFGAPWHVGDAPADYVQRMLGAIVGFEIPIHDLQGKLKLSQNQKSQDRAGVIAGLERRGGEAARVVAAAVEQPGGKTGG